MLIWSPSGPHDSMRYFFTMGTIRGWYRKLRYWMRLLRTWIPPLVDDEFELYDVGSYHKFYTELNSTVSSKKNKMRTYLLIH